MRIWNRILAAALVAITSIAPVAASPAQNSGAWAYPPPEGMTITEGKPRHALALRQTVRLHPKYMRQVVGYRGEERAGTLVVDTGNHFLYLVLGEGKALRYGIGVAKSGFEWSGTHKITNKREWPDWTPPAEMRQRRPELPAHMAGGPGNPLGARALYLGSTLYRIHGTSEPQSIGLNVSSGCIRMVNDDVIDLYSRVSIGTRVVVH